MTWDPEQSSIVQSLGSLCLMGEVAMGAHVASFPGRACSHIDGGRKAMEEGGDKFSVPVEEGDGLQGKGGQFEAQDLTRVKTQEMIKTCDVGAMAEIIPIEPAKSLGAQIALWTAPVIA